MGKPKRKFLMSPYLLFMGSLLMTVVIVVTIKVVIIDVCLWELRTYPPASGNILDSGAVKSFLFIILPTELFLAFLLFRTYEAFGCMEIQEDGLLFRSLFRGKRKLQFSEIYHIGIDYGVLSGGVKQFWIFFSKEKIPKKYIHNMNQMPFTKQTMRIQYSRKVFDALVFYLPKDLSKRLNASYSIIRLYKVDDG